MNKLVDPTRLSARRWVILGFLLVICFVSHFNRASITNAGDERIMKQYGISPERMGIVYSSFLIVYTLFMIPGGWLIDRRGPAFSLALMAAGSAVFCALQVRWVLASFRQALSGWHCCLYVRPWAC